MTQEEKDLLDDTIIVLYGDHYCKLKQSEFKKLYESEYYNEVLINPEDTVGIIAKVSNFLCEHKINIADITQTILSGNFVMMMMVDLENSDISIDELRKNMENQATEMGVEINIMSERVFSAMHRV